MTRTENDFLEAWQSDEALILEPIRRICYGPMLGHAPLPGPVPVGSGGMCGGCHQRGSGTTQCGRENRGSYLPMEPISAFKGLDLSEACDSLAGGRGVSCYSPVAAVTTAAHLAPPNNIRNLTGLRDTCPACTAQRVLGCSPPGHDRGAGRSAILSGGPGKHPLRSHSRCRQSSVLSRCGAEVPCSLLAVSQGLFSATRGRLHSLGDGALSLSSEPEPAMTS